MIDRELIQYEQRTQAALDEMRRARDPQQAQHHFDHAKREIAQAIRLAFERSNKALEKRFMALLVHAHASRRDLY